MVIWRRFFNTPRYYLLLGTTLRHLSKTMDGQEKRGIDCIVQYMAPIILVKLVFELSYMGYVFHRCIIDKKIKALGPQVLKVYIYI